MPALNSVTPLILTFNEAQNIARSRAQLSWADRIVVVDSGSDDGTVELAQSFETTEVFERKFDSHCRQWTYALAQVDSTWTLALDADYIVPDALVEEIASILDSTECSGYWAEFRTVALGRILRRSLYPKRQLLFRTDSASFRQDGHALRIDVEGSVGRLQHWLLHDDRKSLERWLRNQARYAALEAEKLRNTSWADLDWADRMRRARIVAPPFLFLYTLFVRGLILEGWPGIYYALERASWEAVLSMALLRGIRGYPVV